MSIAKQTLLLTIIETGTSVHIDISVYSSFTAAGKSVTATVYLVYIYAQASDPQT